MKFLMFDFDGVIVSSFSLAYEVMKKIGNAPATEDLYREYFNGNVYKAMGPLVGGTSEDRVVSTTPFFQLYGPELLKKKPVFGMVELLKELKTSGHQMVVISSTMDGILEDFLNEHGIRDCFNAIYGSTYHKDKVYKIERALEQEVRSPQEALFITDTLGDMRDATECHVAAVGVSWGYQPVETLKQGNPIAIAETVDDLRSIITK